MKFLVLPEILQPTAKALADFLRAHRGATRFRAERPIAGVESYAPTLLGELPNGRLCAVEVTDGTLPTVFSSFVLECRDRHVPVQLYIAMPSDSRLEDREANRKFAGAQKLGFVLHNKAERSCDVDREALPLSLAGVRHINLPQYPDRFKQALADAQMIYFSGNPNKGASEVWDQLEYATRVLAAETLARGLWKGPAPNGLDIAHGPWATVMQELHESLNFRAVKSVCPELRPTLLAKVIGASGDRNISAHEPATREARAKRDERLRTLFETAVDMFTDVLEAAKPLRLRY